MNTSVTFQTTNQFLARLVNTAETKEAQNIKQLDGKQVLVEGAQYKNIWLETQPMGGEMYAKRNMETALNNILFFMDYQREDGRLPGMISNRTGETLPSFDFQQGFCFTTHALNLYYLNHLDSGYLERLYQCLERFDRYLWTYRDSDGDGCLETWCKWDTGEDESTRLEGAPNNWEGNTPPSGLGKVPYASMDFMSYSYDCRATLARLSDLLGNGRADYWQQQAQAVADKIKAYLWREEKHACFDRDCNHEFLDILQHNNIRCMYHGSFSQQMADDFLKFHVMNPEEFWTPMPLPSIAVNDPKFRNHETNDWSGQPEGLTYQRAILAFENYGHVAELTLLGKKLITVVGKECVFTQQFDPFLAVPSMREKQDGYGPTILAVLEYVSRLYGVHQQFDSLYWGCLDTEGHDQTYTQVFGENKYTLTYEQGTYQASINGKEVFTVSPGVRVITDLTGTVQKVAGISPTPVWITLNAGGQLSCAQLSPNQWCDGALHTICQIPFNYRG